MLRHGPAETRDPVRWPDDRKRPLSEEGVKATRRAARGLFRLLGTVDRFATSRTTRTATTARIAHAAFGGAGRVEGWPELEEEHTVLAILDRVARTARSGERVVLVGHQPTLAEFIGLALTGEQTALVRLGKASAACLEFSAAVRPGAARLVWLLNRKQLAAVRR